MNVSFVNVPVLALGIMPGVRNSGNPLLMLLIMGWLSCPLMKNEFQRLLSIRGFVFCHYIPTLLSVARPRRLGEWLKLPSIHGLPRRPLLGLFAMKACCSPTDFRSDWVAGDRSVLKKRLSEHTGMAFLWGVIIALLRDRIGMNYLLLNIGIDVPDKIFDLIDTDRTGVKPCLIAQERRFDAMWPQKNGRGAEIFCEFA